jgi:hypothetical protein
MWSSFAKRFTKNGSAPRIELFVKLKHKKTASLVKWSRAKRSLSIERKKEVISKSFLYFYPKSFFLGTFSYDPVSYFVSGTLNLFLYAFKPFHQIFLSYAFLT